MAATSRTAGRARNFGFALSQDDSQPTPSSSNNHQGAGGAQPTAAGAGGSSRQQRGGRSNGGGGQNRQQLRNDAAREAGGEMANAPRAPAAAEPVRRSHFQLTPTDSRQPSAEDIQRARKHLEQAAIDQKARIAKKAQAGGAAVVEEAEEEEDVCIICAEPIKFYALGQCSHRSCHVCSLRLRALYKVQECSVCKTVCSRVIFTDSPDLPFNSFPPDSLPFSDPTLGLLFPSQEIMESALSLIRFNCPSPGCDSVLRNWAELRAHVRAAHQKQLCDLCTRHKKIFAHEFPLYTPRELKIHETVGDDADAPPGSAAAETREQSGFKGHPICGFCRIRFYDDDQLYDHCKKQHEQCFLCSRTEAGRFQYFKNWDALERHFNTDHYPCPEAQCLAEKFVVFASKIDLQAHAVEKHGASGKDIRRVETNFSYAAPATSHGQGRGARRGPAGGGGARGGGGEEGSLQFENAIGDAGAGPASITMLPRRVPGLGPRVEGGQNERETRATPAPAADLNTLTPVGSTAANPTERHALLIRIVSDAVGGSPQKVDAFKKSVKSYRGGEQTAEHFLDFLTNFFGRDMNVTGRVTAGVVDLLDNEERKVALRRAWRDFKVENDQFPSLAPSAPSVNGEPSASASRHLQSHHGAKNAKAASRTHQGGGSSAVWDRVERAASSASGSQPYVPGLHRPPQTNRAGAFPPLGNPTASTSTSTSTANFAASARSPIVSVSAAGTGPAFRSNAFPSLAAGAASTAGGAAINSQRRKKGEPPSSEYPSLPTAASAVEARARLRAALAGPPASARTGAVNPGGTSWGPALGQVSQTGGEPSTAAGGGRAQKKGKKVVLPLA